MLTYASLTQSILILNANFGIDNGGKHRLIMKHLFYINVIFRVSGYRSPNCRKRNKNNVAPLPHTFENAGYFLILKLLWN
jgi:hypothetical protein